MTNGDSLTDQIILLRYNSNPFIDTLISPEQSIH